MQCRNCGLENVADSTACFRCNAALAMPQTTFELPQRRRFKRWLRPLRFALNRLNDWMPNDLLQRASSYILADGLSPKATAAMSFSVIPGLGHLVQKRYLQAVFFFSLWVIAGGVCLNFYSTWIGGIALGFVFCWPAIAGFHAAREYMNIEDFFDRMQFMASIQLVALFLCLMCFFLSRRVVQLPKVETAIPGWNVQVGDTLLVFASEEVRAGELALVKIENQWIQGTYYRLAATDMVVPILAVAGDKVHVEDKEITINGRPIPAELLPGGPLPYPPTPMTFTVPKGSVFAPFPITIRIDNDVRDRLPLYGALWTDNYVFSNEDVFGSVSGVYLPLSRRRRMTAEERNLTANANNGGGE